jgi:transcriptional regulator of acetoin/glycerol metabolism
MAAGSGLISLADLPDQLAGAVGRIDCEPDASSPAGVPPASMPPAAQLLLQYLRAARWNVSAVAHQLGVARMTAYRRMKRWGIREPERG